MYSAGANSEESKANRIPLPSVLGGITSAEAWYERRCGIITDYKRLMYGELPPTPDAVRVDLLDQQDGALGGIAIRRELAIRLTGPYGEHSIHVLWYLPRNAVGPVPAIAALNFQGNPSTATEEIMPSPGSLPPGAQAARWSYRRLLENGFAVATAWRSEIFPDHHRGCADSVWRIFRTREELKNRSCTAISAWAYAYTLLADLFRNDPAVDSSRIWAHGHSRLGKAALWAAANDQRIAGVVSNDSGCCGAAPNRHNFGEPVGYITQSFPHWFVPALDSYAGREQELPFDQNFLLALIAPRPLLVASATEDLWADPRGEFLSTRAASEVWRLFGCDGLPVDAEWPPPDTPLFGGRVGYCLRTGVHDVTDLDWQFVLQFILNSPL